MGQLKATHALWGGGGWVVLFAFAAAYKFGSNTRAELRAVYNGLAYCGAMRFVNVEVESNSMFVVGLLIGSQKSSWRWMYRMRRIDRLSVGGQGARGFARQWDDTGSPSRILVGCDGVNSIVAESLKLKPTRSYNTVALRGLTYYPNGHGVDNDFVRTRKGRVIVGKHPINDKLVYWFISRPQLLKDSEISGKPELIRQTALEAMKGFPSEITELAENSMDDSLNSTNIRYRAPWDVLLGNLRRGMVTVAGDALHVMGPFLGQGGAAGLEDAVMLARCLAKARHMEPNGDLDGK
ncbi:monooxygenase 1-like [Magnolia sinica]|uniref:monooxygenase 1-like n=1 Tax=Magnolia sinica TaxID=86752 RepID=UPI002659D931|nr:monooxygenase 1-like [Magnolia sinica]